MITHINYVTNAELCDIIRQNLYKIPHEIDGVICIPRGGLFVGAMVAEFLHKPMYTVESFINQKTIGCGSVECGIPETNFKRYIVIDDSVSSGKSFHQAHEQLKNFPYEFIYVACIGKESQTPNTDIILYIVPEFRLFEFNFFRSSWVRHCIFDIDGVLCPNPEPGIDLSEEKYLDHLNNVKPLILPQFSVKALCTHRLKQYYEPTAKWLERHGINYDMLYMLSFDSIEEKIRNLNSDIFRLMKTDVYQCYPEALLFVESDYNEAMTIYQNTHRPVLCTDRNIILQD